MRSAAAALARRAAGLASATPRASAALLADGAGPRAAATSSAAAQGAWPAAIAAASPAWRRGLATGPPASGPPDDASHDDFKPTFAGGAGAGGASPASAADIIKADIETHRVFVYMKGEPEAPQCGFSNMVCRILDAYGVDYGSRNVLADPAIRDGIKAFTGWPTIPQVFAKAEFLGGADILMAMHNAGELEAALTGVEKKEGGEGGDGHVHGPGCKH